MTPRPGHGRAEPKLIPAAPPHAYPARVPSDRGASRGIVGRMGLRASRPGPLRVRSIAARPIGRDNGDRFIQYRIGNIRCDSAEVPTSSGPNRQARSFAGTQNEAEPPDTRARSRTARGRRCSTPSTSTRHRHAAVDCETPPGSAHPSDVQARNPAGSGLTGLSVRYCNLTDTLSLAPVASMTDIRMKPLPGGCQAVSRRRCGPVTGVPSTSQV